MWENNVYIISSAIIVYIISTTKITLISDNIGKKTVVFVAKQ